MLSVQGMRYGGVLRVAVACVLVMAGAAAWGQDLLQYEHSATMRTRDGVVLRADIYRPSGGGTHPVLLQRTPYNKEARWTLR